MLRRVCDDDDDTRNIDDCRHLVRAAYNLSTIFIAIRRITMMTVDGIRNSEDKKQTNSPALKISISWNFVNHLELKQDSECQIHFQISKFCKLSFDRSFLGRTWRVWWNCLSVIGLMPKLPPSSILRGPSDCPNAALWPGSHPSPVPPSSTWFPTKVDHPRFILPDLWRRLQEHIVLGMMGLH